MQTNSLHRSWQLLCVVTIAVVVCGPAITARASCAAHPARIVWSYPAAGDRSVPLDAEIRVLSRGPLDSQFEATLNGAVISPSENGVYPTDGLEPDTDYVFRIVGPKPRSSAEETPTLFELSFHTGTELGSEAPTPQLLGSSHATSFPEFTELCSAAHSSGECFDTPTYVYYDLELEHGDAVAWLVTNLSTGIDKLWPSACDPVLTVHELDREPTCFELHAIGANGELSEATEYCTTIESKSKMTLSQTARPEQGSTGTSSCAVATLSGDRGASALWLCGAALYFLRRLRRGTRAALRARRPNKPART